MQVLVTGGAGFIGSHLADYLLARGDSVVALDNLSTGSESNISAQMGNPEFEFVLGSVLDANLVDALMQRADVVFHLAAAVGVRLIVERPMEGMLTNIRGTETVLEKAHRYRKKVLLASTSEIYGKSPAVPLREDADRLLGSPLVARWSYSTAKAADEIMAHAYWVSDGLPTVIARLFNTVGPRQAPHYGMVLPRFIDAALANRDLDVYGTGEQTRCFGYVGDIVPALVSLMESKEAEGQAVNLGSTEEVTIKDLAELVIQATGSGSKIRLTPYEDAFGSGFEDTLRRVPDIQKARELIGFEPRTSLTQTVNEMVADAKSKTESEPQMPKL